MRQQLHFLVGSLIFFSVFTPFSSALDLVKSERCIVAISEALVYLSFAGSRNSSFLDRVCTNELRTFSLYAAAKVYCKPTEIDDGILFLDNECESKGFARIPYSTIEPMLTDEYVANLRVVEFKEVDKGVEQTDPILISRDFFWRAYRTNEAWAFETWAHHAFGNVAYWFWGLVLLIGIVNRLASSYPGSSISYERLDMESQIPHSPKKPTRVPTPLMHAYHWIKTHLIVPAAIGTYHQRLLYWCSIPTRMEAIVIVLYYIISLVLGVLAYDLFRGNLYWDDTLSQFWRYLSDRTGIMSYANLLMLWLFGGRNNVFLWATGWSFSTFNLFHRAIARVATIQAIVHSIGYTIIALNTGTYTVYWPSAWWYMGAVATICMSLLLGFSSVWLRRNYYELFLIIHIALSIIGLVALFIHTSIFNGGYDHYLWPVVAVWAADRFMRLVRLVSCNLQVHMKIGGLSATKSVARYDKATDLIRLDVFPASIRALPKPGQFYYIYQPIKWTGYENHPFTVASWSTPGTAVDTLGASDLNSTAASESQLAFTDIENGGKTGDEKTEVDCRLTFWIRPLNGWTRRLRSDCMAHSNRMVNTTFLLEGPYGIHNELNRYDNVILIAGGTGIAAVLPHIEEYLRRTPPSKTTETTNDFDSLLFSSSPYFADSTRLTKMGNKAFTRTKSITLVWTVRQQGYILDLAATELQPALKHGDIEFHFHVTNHKLPFDFSSLSQARADETSRLLSPSSPSSESAILPRGIKIQTGRPSLNEIVNDSLASSPGSASTAVLVCGPAEMADETRATVHDALKRGYSRLDYFEESFGW